jgi:hypothetical protein
MTESEKINSLRHHAGLESLLALAQANGPTCEMAIAALGGSENLALMIAALAADIANTRIKATEAASATKIAESTIKERLRRMNPKEYGGAP